MRFGRKTFYAVVAAAGLALSAPLLASPQSLADLANWVDLSRQKASEDALYVARWVMRVEDHQGQPFVIVDKKEARIFVFAPGGQLVGSSSVLLGQALGDHSVPGIGERPLSQILPHERTTPAGRFASEPGRNLEGEHVIWVEYETGFAIHRLRPNAAQEQRLRRLRSQAPEDKRASLGCVVVPVAFYEGVILPMLGSRRSVVYVLPETQPVQALFGGARDL